VRRNRVEPFVFEAFHPVDAGRDESGFVFCLGFTFEQRKLVGLQGFNKLKSLQSIRVKCLAVVPSLLVEVNYRVSIVCRLSFFDLFSQSLKDIDPIY
jgi:hypothetical protein